MRKERENSKRGDNMGRVANEVRKKTWLLLYEARNTNDPEYLRAIIQECTKLLFKCAERINE